jgi:hypothetical protein
MQIERVGSSAVGSSCEEAVLHDRALSLKLASFALANHLKQHTAGGELRCAHNLAIHGGPTRAEQAGHNVDALVHESQAQQQGTAVADNSGHLSASSNQDNNKPTNAGAPARNAGSAAVPPEALVSRRTMLSAATATASMGP